jgi:hypothetical protein
MLDAILISLVGIGIIAGFILLKRKLEDREAKLSSGEEICKLKQNTDGVMKKFVGTIAVKQHNAWYRILMNIDIEQIIEGRRHSLPDKFNNYSIEISNDRGRTIFCDSGSLRPFILNLRASHKKRDSGVWRECNIYSRTGQVILLEFYLHTPGKYQITLDCQTLLEEKTKKYNFKSVLNDLEIVIKENIEPISERGEFHHKIIKLKN